ncbi:MAG: nuclear transport factor 2 family protein [Rhodospirillales bacterium]|nr:nuclear transport factor 2 family protein [Rhodospirillales bacterium]
MSALEDMFLIQNHLAAYCHAVDRGTLDEVAELFHENAVMTPAYEGGAPLHGRDAIRGWYANYNTYFRSDQVTHLRHQITTPVIQVNGNEATSTCYFDADVLDADKKESLRFYGRYDDKLVKEDGRWVFMDRVINGYYALPTTDYRMLGG